MRYLIIIEVEGVFEDYQDIMWNKQLALKECRRLNSLNPDEQYSVQELPLE